MLRLHNTMTRRVAEFKAIDDKNVGMYTCGLTVYNYAHIGNLRMYVFEDILKRVLLVSDYRVRHVMNITDVGHLTSDADAGEDKMEKGASREGKTAWEIAEYFQQAFVKDLKRLNVLPPDVWCKATDHIAEQIDLVRQLEAKGFTYVIDGDGVYFDTSRLSDYGKLARLDIAGLQAGSRVEMVKGKRKATDFALWKFSPSDKKRQMEWPSPWGVGFPGWHIECSAMAIKYLGQRLDIHCGGVDHIPVHHTNEIAQSETVLGHPWVNWWIHGEFLTFPAGADGREVKMSKSSGEFLTLDLLVKKGYDPLAYRYFCLGAHYRQQLAFSWESLDSAASGFERLRQRVIAIRTACGGKPGKVVQSRLDEFMAAAQDDLNMPRALAAMWGLLRETDAPDADLHATLLEMDRVLGFDLANIQPRKVEISPEDESRINKLVDERLAARKAKDYARADAIRKQLTEMGVEIKDAPQGTTWRKT